MTQNYFGIDLGSYDIKIFEAATDEISSYKNAIAVRKVQNKKQVLATGDEAYDMYERCAADISIIYPLQGGVVSDFDAMQYLLQTYVWGKRHRSVSGSGYLLAAPSDVSELEKKTLFDLVVRSDARSHNVRLVPKAIADTIGMNLPVFTQDGLFTINIGGGTTEYSIICAGGLMLNKMDKTGGKDLDQAIANFIRKEYGFLIGIFAAEDLKNCLGSAFAAGEGAYRFVAGRNLVSGLPGEIQISAHEVYSALRPGLDRIVENCRQILDRIPPEMALRIRDEGLYVTGGVANLQNLGKFMEHELGIPVHIATEPEYTTVMGLRAILADPKYDELTYSMLDRHKRWMR